MIFSHTNHVTKRGSPEGVLMAKASDTDIFFIAVSMLSALWNMSTAAVNFIWPRSALENSCPCDVRLYWAQRRAVVFTP